MTTLRIALAQVNTIVGDLHHNVGQITAALQRARELACDVVLLPELAVTGYPPEDLLLKPAFVEASRGAIDELADATQGLTAVVGFADVDGDVYNAAAVLHDGRLVGIYHKHYLPTYGVFDEDRYFRAGVTNPVFVRGDVTLGVSICEDIWYPEGPPQLQARGGAHLLLNLSASPYHAGKAAARERMLATRAADNVAVVAFCNLVGGQDELVFDGGSVVFDERGELLARGAQFDEDFFVTDVDLGSVFRHRLHDPRWRKQPAGDVAKIILPPIEAPAHRPPVGYRPIVPLLPRVGEVYRALVVATRDYVRKNGFHRVVIGLSGGVDSSLVACVAADALGPENVTGVAMPSRYSAEMSQTDAALLARALGIDFKVIPIEQPFQAFLDTLADPFAGRGPDVTEENLQARIRGNLLMALSNKFGWLVLTTGNKSEMSVGYATLYGDMAGGYAVIKDVPKTLVYELVRWRNSQGDTDVIPERVITRAPSAELRPDQQDTDSLPPYEMLDPILQAYVEEDCAPDEIVAQGYDEAVVRRMVRMVDQSEYKRRQAPPGVKITTRAFGRDRRLPITNRYGRS
ncbi:MAG: NAD+ synthase [Anaerolineales bacterium]|nr:NAD+ synthase [Anaerolineales bacterium]